MRQRANGLLLLALLLDLKLSIAGVPGKKKKALHTV